MSIESPPSKPDADSPSQLRHVLERAGLLAPNVSTTEIEAIEDPLAGPLLSREEREILANAEQARASRFFGIRALQIAYDWITSDEPNMSNGDTRLDVPA